MVRCWERRKFCAVVGWKLLYRHLNDLQRLPSHAWQTGVLIPFHDRCSDSQPAFWLRSFIGNSLSTWCHLCCWPCIWQHVSRGFARARCFESIVTTLSCGPRCGGFWILSFHDFSRRLISGDASSIHDISHKIAVELNWIRRKSQNRLFFKASSISVSKSSQIKSWLDRCGGCCDTPTGHEVAATQTSKNFPWHQALTATPGRLRTWPNTYSNLLADFVP